MAKPKNVTVPVFLNVKELRRWVTEQKRSGKTYDVTEVQKQLEKLFHTQVS